MLPNINNDYFIKKALKERKIKNLFLILIIFNLTSIILLEKPIKIITIAEFSALSLQSNLFIFTIIFPSLYILFYVYENIGENISFMIRRKDFKNHLKDIFKKLIIIITIIYFLNIFIFFVFNVLFSSKIVLFRNNMSFNFHNYLYFLFVIVKLYVINVLLLIINLFILFKKNKLMCLLVNLFFVFILVITPSFGIPIESIKEIPLFLNSYIIQKNYKNFITEATFAFLYLSVSFSIVLLIVNNFLRKGDIN